MRLRSSNTMRRDRWVSDGSADSATNGAKGGPGGSGTRPPSTRRRPHGRHDARGPAESRQSLHVALTRGRSENHIYIADAAVARQPPGVDSLNPTTAEDILAGILRRDGAQTSATSTRRILDASAAQLRDAVVRYQDALGRAADHVLGQAQLAALDQVAEQLITGLTTNPLPHPAQSSRAAGARRSEPDARTSPVRRIA
jgi:hypothetical protein